MSWPIGRCRVVQDGKVALTRAYGQRDVEADLPVTTVDEVILHQPNGTFVAQRVEE
jgi:hypothetical protein